MAKELACTFQHTSGMHIGAVYSRKKLKLEMMDTLEDMRPYITDEEVYLKAANWCKEHNNKRFETVEQAVRFLKNEGIEGYIEFERS